MTSSLTAAPFTPSAPDAQARAETKTAGRIGFVHQNDVFGMQGGIERYVSTILSFAGGRAALASPPVSRGGAPHFAAPVRGPEAAPQWLRFLLGLFARRRAFRAWLKAEAIGVLDYSRPEYALLAWMFPGKRVFTIHGTGPGPGHRAHRLLHDACCFLLPLLADRVQVVGRDPSGLPRPVRALLGARLVHIDAWHDECFAPRPLPPTDGALKVFYAGRLAAQKNPELLFEILREAERTAPGAFEFHYFGSDYAAFVQAGLGDAVHDHGFLGPQALAEAIGACHFGLLCSAYGEGSPYILIESLACGRPFVVSALPTLTAAYEGKIGVRFVARQAAADFVAAMLDLARSIREGALDPDAVAAQVRAQAQSRAVPALLDALSRLEAPRPC
ncbi:glycosyltransferase involved in cell wall biosynthesis [Rhodoblastus acidophilus]|uniref:glycosyltransferase family 4 protein n=1 Tax=Rhodoblastus acidophilus TaxID=1074 RepID=UPI0022251FE1|nr:glycosyltransferase family 4 protein [Rhodoblastus acidophilus]MCW2317522.1 glycosyltransferase involved in cell wall biosynthesis [Rhodoblastus acidophilus]